jgi:hypothetical protein
MGANFVNREPAHMYEVKSFSFSGSSCDEKQIYDFLNTFQRAVGT